MRQLKEGDRVELNPSYRHYEDFKNEPYGGVRTVRLRPSTGYPVVPRYDELPNGEYLPAEHRIWILLRIAKNIIGGKVCQSK